MKTVTTYLLAALIGLGLASGPAKATPPDIITVHDEVFAINQSHIFLLRRTHDNMGLHISGKDDIYLVAKSIETGFDETFWPIYRTSRYPDYRTDDSGLSEKLDVEPLDSAINPYDILAEHNALPIAGERFLTVDDLKHDQNATLTPDTLSISRDGVVKYQLSTEALLAQIDQSMTGLQNAFQNYDRFAPVDSKDVLYYQPFELEDCSAGEAMRARYLLHLDKVQLARVVCDYEDGFAPVSLYVVVPPLGE